VSVQISLLAPVLFILLSLGSLLRSAPGQVATQSPSELAQAQLKAAREAYRQLVEAEKKGQRSFDPERHYVWSKRILEAERQVARNKEEVFTAFEEHFKRMTTLETKAKQFARAGTVGADQVAAVAFYRAEAAVWKERAKVKK
jgi:hypothetical protein